MLPINSTEGVAACDEHRETSEVTRSFISSQISSWSRREVPPTSGSNMHPSVRQRDLDLALPSLICESIDRLTANCQKVARVCRRRGRVEWGSGCSRLPSVERMRDNAVDIGEQVAFRSGDYEVHDASEQALLPDS